MTQLEIEIVPGFSRDEGPFDIPGCQLLLDGIGGSSICGVTAVFCAGYADDQEPVFCCVQHIAEGIEFKVQVMPSSMFNPRLVWVTFVAETKIIKILQEAAAPSAIEIAHE